MNRYDIPLIYNSFMDNDMLVNKNLCVSTE